MIMKSEGETEFQTEEVFREGHFSNYREREREVAVLKSYQE